MTFTNAHGAQLTINLPNIYHNWQLFNGHMHHGIAAAVIKANAYGLGAIKVAHYLESRHIRTFFVAHLSEAIELKESGIKGQIFVLNGLSTARNDMAAYLEYGLIPVIGSLYELKSLYEFLKSQNQKMPIALHVDTGMNRLGFPIYEWKELHPDHSYLSYCDIKLIMSHLACADDALHPYNEQQKNYFQQACQKWPNIPKSFGNSAGILLSSAYQGEITRPGIGLYGGNPFTDGRPCPVQNVVSLTAPIIQIRNLRKGESVGYSNGWIAPKESQVATLSIGYGDGWMRSSAADAYMMIHNHKIPLIGRISMDTITLDITELPSSLKKIGQNVEILGEHITINHMAKWAQTIPYEILTNIGSRYSRCYVET